MRSGDGVGPRSRPSASVVICAYTEKRWDDLAHSVDALANSSNPPEEIVVVIDHKTTPIPESVWREHGEEHSGQLDAYRERSPGRVAGLGASIAFEALGDVVGVSIRARGGLWGGATQEVKLTAGGFLGGAAYMLFHLGGGVAIDVGLEVWGIFGDGETALFSPSAGLTWSPP